MKLILWCGKHRIQYAACDETGALVDQGEVCTATELLELPTLAARFIGEPLRVFASDSRLSFRRIFPSVEPVSEKTLDRELLRVRKLEAGEVFLPEWYQPERHEALTSNWEIKFDG